MLPFDDETSLSMLFHLNSEPWSNTEAYESAVYEVEYKDVVPVASELQLLPSVETDVSRAAARRTSCRAFAPKPLPLSLLGAILRSSFGISRGERISGDLLAQFRHAPSAGGLYPLEIYFL